LPQLIFQGADALRVVVNEFRVSVLFIKDFAGQALVPSLNAKKGCLEHVVLFPNNGFQSLVLRSQAGKGVCPHSTTNNEQ
jgi:hypothetical protein